MFDLLLRTGAKPRDPVQIIPVLLFERFPVRATSTRERAFPIPTELYTVIVEYQAVTRQGFGHQ